VASARKKPETGWETVRTAREVLAGEGEADAPLLPQDVLNEELLLTAFEELQGNYGYYAIIHFERKDGSKGRFRCGGKVVLRKLAQLSRLEAFPVRATLVRVGRYFDLR